MRSVCQTKGTWEEENRAWSMWRSSLPGGKEVLPEMSACSFLRSCHKERHRIQYGLPRKGCVAGTGFCKEASKWVVLQLHESLWFSFVKIMHPVVLTRINKDTAAWTCLTLLMAWQNAPMGNSSSSMWINLSPDQKLKRQWSGSVKHGKPNPHEVISCFYCACDRYRIPRSTTFQSGEVYP